MTDELQNLRALVAAHEQVLAFAAALARSRKTGALQAMTARLNIVPCTEEDGRKSVEALERARDALSTETAEPSTPSPERLADD